MKNLILAHLLILFFPKTSVAAESAVYMCQIEGNVRGIYSVRMKKYFDANEKMNLGKVDLLENSEVVETFKTKVYQIQLYGKQSFVQLWYHPQSPIRVDAEMSYTQGGQDFQAQFLRNNEKIQLVCHELQD